MRTIGLHLFCSVKGGVGKSTLSVVAAKLLARMGQVPVLVDADMLGSSLADGLALCAPVVELTDAGLLDLEAPATGRWHSLSETRRLRELRREWLERCTGTEAAAEAVAPAYLNDALNYSVPDPRRECSVAAMLWKHETADGVWYASRFGTMDSQRWAKPRDFATPVYDPLTPPDNEKPGATEHAGIEGLGKETGLSKLQRRALLDDLARRATLLDAASTH